MVHIYEILGVKHVLGLLFKSKCKHFNECGRNTDFITPLKSTHHSICSVKAC